MISHADLPDKKLKNLLRSGAIVLAGNKKLKIYGTLRCASGKRMKAGNRVFFDGEKEAVLSGYRPCGHCMQQAYRKWKDDHRQITNQ